MSEKKKSKSTTKKAVKKKTLVIVESPAKAKTIEKYLGADYLVKASMGHLIDLPKSRIAVGVENNFEPEYITVRGRAKLLKELQGDAKKSERVLLASDNDREGEAIAWHLKQSFESKTNVDIRRIVFNEITPDAINNAVKNPMDIDENKVNAQKARRVLDRLVGYNLSPLLWKKVKNGLSAGRVQSVALKLICEREVEVEKFIPEEYWSLQAVMQKDSKDFNAQLVLYNDKKPELKNLEEVNTIIEKVKNEKIAVEDIRDVERTIRPKAPFTTSTLQQMAANRLGFTSKKTMQIAQQLYEGINIGSTRVGLITYMRTDSVRISNTALEDLRAWIKENHPKELPEKANEYSVGKKSQDAHEAIRPTYTKYTPKYLKEFLTRDQMRLYSVIWERFVSSQMLPAKSKTTSIDIKVENAIFRTTFTKIVNKGFYKVLKTLKPKSEKQKALPNFIKGDTVEVIEFLPEQHFTQGPSRYTDASIIKTLEEKGIGRPSTYAPTISVLLDRYYVTRSNKQLVPTLLGKIINDLLVENFSNIIDVDFTASVENSLDLIEESKVEWQKMIGDFYNPFKKRLDEVTENLDSIKGNLDEETDYVCEKCGKPMLKKLGRFGFFLACSGFPECRNAKSIPLAKCPKEGCDGDVVARKTKGRGKEFYGCTNYPECEFLTHFKPTDEDCPECGYFLVEKYDKKNGSVKACINENCNYSNLKDNLDEKTKEEIVNE